MAHLNFEVIGRSQDTQSVYSARSEGCNGERTQDEKCLHTLLKATTYYKYNAKKENLLLCKVWPTYGYGVNDIECSYTYKKNDNL